MHIPSLSLSLFGKEVTMSDVEKAAKAVTTAGFAVVGMGCGIIMFTFGIIILIALISSL